jgi:hypothetical protein
VNFDEVRVNARSSGVDLHSIAIVYANLSPAEKQMMHSEGLITHEAPESGTVIAHFRADTSAAFPDKATGVLYLAAD